MAPKQSAADQQPDAPPEAAAHIEAPVRPDKLNEPFAKEEKSADESVSFACGGRTRFFILFLSMTCMSMIVANSLSFNFTVICMRNSPGRENETWEEEDKSFIFTDFQRNWLFSIIALGTICGVLPFFFMAGRAGIRPSFALYATISGVATLLVPAAVPFGFAYVLGLRFLQGVALAALWPSTGSITTEWSTLKRSGTYIAILSCHLQIGPVLVMPVAGELCASPLGWGSVYYFLGAATLLFAALFAALYRDQPARHALVGHRELRVLRKGKESTQKDEKRPKVPFGAIFTDKAVLGTLFTTFGGNLGYQILNQYGAFFLNTVIKFDVRSTGFVTALPFLFAITLKVLAGPVSDKMPFFSPRGRVILFAALSHFTMSGAFISMAFFDEGTKLEALIVFMTAVTFSGLNAMGNIKSLQLISGPFVYVLMAVVTLSSSICILILPMIVELMAPNNSKEEWSRMWILFGGFIIMSTFVFAAVAEATPRPWATSQVRSRASNKVRPLQVDVADLARRERPQAPQGRRRDSLSSEDSDDVRDDDLVGILSRSCRGDKAAAQSA